MNKRTKYLASLTIVIFSLIFLISEANHDYIRMKWLYASFYPNKYFEKDVIIYEGQTSGAGSGGRDMYYFYGKLKNHEGGSRIFYNEKSMKKLWGDNLEIPVWYCNINGSVGIRTGQSPPKPYSFSLLDSQITILVWLLFIPAIAYIIKYRIDKRKSKPLKRTINEN